MWITPTGATADRICPENLVQVRFSDGAVIGSGKPSSEWHFHRAILMERPEMTAVVHTHSPHATTLACLRESLPAFHYMVAFAGGNDVRCTPYEVFGSEQLSRVAVAALKDRKACLLANHGSITVGKDLEEAMAIANEIESLCGQYLACKQAGRPSILSKKQMAVVIEKFKTYKRAPRGVSVWQKGQEVVVLEEDQDDGFDWGHEDN